MAAVGQHGDADDGQPGQPVALAGQASLAGCRSGWTGRKLGPGGFGATFTEAHGRVSARTRSTGPRAPSRAGVGRADIGAAAAGRPRAADASPHPEAGEPAGGRRLGPGDRPRRAGPGPAAAAGSVAS